MDTKFDSQDIDEEDGALEIDWFMSDDGLHKVSWKLSEIKGLEYEAWWCETHDKLYYGGCLK